MSTITVHNAHTHRNMRFTIQKKANTPIKALFRGGKRIGADYVRALLYEELEKGERRRLRKWLRANGFEKLACL